MKMNKINMALRNSTLALAFVFFVAIPTNVQAADTYTVQTAIQTPIQTVLLTSIHSSILTPVQTALATAGNKVLLTLTNGQKVVLQVFKKGNGTPAVQLTQNKKKLVAVSPNGKALRSFSLKTLNRTDAKKLRKKRQNGAAVHIYKASNKNTVVIATRRGLKLTTTTYRLKKNGKLAKRNSKRVTLQSKGGNPVITESGTVVRVSVKGTTYNYTINKKGHLKRK